MEYAANKLHRFAYATQGKAVIKCLRNNNSERIVYMPMKMEQELLA